MLYYGKHITTPSDTLHPIEPGVLFAGIMRPKLAFVDTITQLRALRSLDPAQYRDAKKRLPYIVCGRFHPAIRRKEYFAAIQYLIIDLDHLSEHDTDSATLRTDLAADPAVLGYFQSPGGDGLKVMFQLDKPCTDSALFSSFYKLFVRDFARKYDVSACIDNATHDVTRACFISYDPDARFNPQPTLLRIQECIPDLDFEQVSHEIREAEKEMRTDTVEQKNQSPDKNVLDKIKSKLNPGARPARTKNYIVPEEVDTAMEVLRHRLPDWELILRSAEPISYGRKIQVQATGSLLFAEINLFYGRKGFTLVLTTRSGSNQELGEMACQIITTILREEKLSN